MTSKHPGTQGRRDRGGPTDRQTEREREREKERGGGTDRQTERGESERVSDRKREGEKITHQWNQLVEVWPALETASAYLFGCSGILIRLALSAFSMLSARFLPAFCPLCPYSVHGPLLKLAKCGCVLTWSFECVFFKLKWDLATFFMFSPQLTVFLSLTLKSLWLKASAIKHYIWIYFIFHVLKRSPAFNPERNRHAVH